MADKKRRRNRTSSQKELILHNAGRLFSEKGYDRTIMKDIARACGFEAGNIYNYFHSKEHLLYKVINEELDRTLLLVKNLEDDNSLTATERLELLLRSYFDSIAGQHRANRLIFDTELRNLSPTHLKQIIAKRDKLDRIMRNIIRSGIESGEFSEIDEAIACFAVSSMIIRSRIWFSPGGRLSSDEIGDIMVRIAMDGLRGKRVNKVADAECLGDTPEFSPHKQS